MGDRPKNRWAPTPKLDRPPLLFNLVGVFKVCELVRLQRVGGRSQTTEKTLIKENNMSKIILQFVAPPRFPESKSKAAIALSAYQKLAPDQKAGFLKKFSSNRRDLSWVGEIADVESNSTQTKTSCDEGYCNMADIFRLKRAVPTRDDLVPLTVDLLVEILKNDVEQVIEVPKIILLDWVRHEIRCQWSSESVILARGRDAAGNGRCQVAEWRRSYWWLSGTRHVKWDPPRGIHRQPRAVHKYWAPRA